MSDQIPALELPQISVPCTYCGADPGAPCTLHGGRRVRPYDTHQDRTAAYNATRTTARTTTEEAQ
ncbi:hypothetical protein FZ103_00160 [Streptomonospora sp. PA3]|uniref:zinc finger domain-containing protein n=1 Tax=Streptomonospora sp. PA3 TaxID=2607326 RepID=UPI0012DEFC28|nr:hypothetical protein [Streptomonospora sp. PA3]MUL39607.1 hypothetical protein [Streptomonospora sp. PA3]